jgi:alkanesulfonate monooxygenase SsuD/methylene tetrahydromethanopterin reductase-like flavin-dependent oxidoreductase (luciferase family)
VAAHRGVRRHLQLRSYAATYAHQFYLSHLQRKTPYTEEIERIVGVDLLNDIHALAKSFDMYEHEKIGGRNEVLVTDKIIDFFMICGTADDCIERLSELQDLGVDRMIYSVYPLRDKIGTIQRFAEEVMPSFR